MFSYQHTYTHSGRPHCLSIIGIYLANFFLVPSYTACQKKDESVNNLSTAVMQQCHSGSQNHNLLISSLKLYHKATRLAVDPKARATVSGSE